MIDTNYICPVCGAKAYLGLNKIDCDTCKIVEELKKINDFHDTECSHMYDDVGCICDYCRERENEKKAAGEAEKKERAT